MRELRNEVARLNPKDAEYIKTVFNTYLTKSLPPMPGFFETLDFPLSNDFDKAYKTIIKSAFKFHALDENLQYKNQENHFKYCGYYEQIFEDID